MKQLCYNICLALLQGSSHGNRLAKQLKTNAMSIHRSLQTLEQNNILEKQQQGKNLIYSIKNSLEAKATLIQAEQERLKQFTKNHPEFRLAIQQLQTLNVPVIIFGSHAKGTERSTSDLDVYAESENKALRKKITSFHSRISAHVGILQEGPLMHSIHEQHIIVRGVERFLETHPLFSKTSKGRETLL